MKNKIFSLLLIILACILLASCTPTPQTTDTESEKNEGDTSTDTGSQGGTSTDSGEGTGDSSTSNGEGTGDSSTSSGEGAGDSSTSNGEGTGDSSTSSGEGDTNTDGENPSEKPEESYEIGTQIGQKLPSYFVETFDENGLSGECIDPSALGKVTVINFWGTWCPPCVGELPEFSEVATEYKDSVTIVAIHSVQNFSTGAVSHIKNNFADSDIIFAADEDRGEGISYYDECYETFGGNGYYPYTIIIDENGVITYAKEGALSKAALISKIEASLAG